MLEEGGLSRGVGDEGGFGGGLKGREDGLECILWGIEVGGYVGGKDVMIGMECGCCEFYKDGV